MATETLTSALRRAHSEGRLADTVDFLTEASARRPAFESAAEAGDVAARLVCDGMRPELVCVPSFLAGSGAHQFIRFAVGFPERRRVSALALPGFRPEERAPGSW